MKNLNKINFNIFKKEFSNLKTKEYLYDYSLPLNPWFVTGLTEAEGSFSILKHTDKRALYSMGISMRFKIAIKKEYTLMKQLANFFNCGVIYESSNDLIEFSVRDQKSIDKIIIPHFQKYPLQGTKYNDSINFCKVNSIFVNKKHRTLEGFNEIIRISKYMNLYKPKLDFKNRKNQNFNILKLNGNYINGFIAGDGSLSLSCKGTNFGRMSLQISQHRNNYDLLISIYRYFNLKSFPSYHGVQSIQITISGKKN